MRRTITVDNSLYIVFKREKKKLQLLESKKVKSRRKIITNITVSKVLAKRLS